MNGQRGSCARNPFGASRRVKERMRSNGFIATRHINGFSEFSKFATAVGVCILEFTHFKEAGTRSSCEILHDVCHAFIDAKGEKHEVDNFGGLQSGKDDNATVHDRL